MTADPQRVTVDCATFAAWRRAAPGLALPGEFAVQTHGPATRAPEFVAAALAVHADPDVTVGLWTRDASARVVVCTSVHDGLGAVLVRALRSGGDPADDEIGDLDGWVQVAVVPADAVPQEIASWVPDAGDREAVGTATLTLTVTRPCDAASRLVDAWRTRDGRWRRLVDDEVVTPVLVERLVRRELGRGEEGSGRRAG